jgi:5-methylcytosine-specific restriction endonuclease McrA
VDRSPTRDHILPRSVPGEAHKPGIAYNLRWLCRHCNQLRGRLGHCTALVAAVYTVKEKSFISLISAIRVINNGIKPEEN